MASAAQAAVELPPAPAGSAAPSSAESSHPGGKQPDDAKGKGGKEAHDEAVVQERPADKSDSKGKGKAPCLLCFKNIALRIPHGRH